MGSLKNWFIDTPAKSEKKPDTPQIMSSVPLVQAVYPATPMIPPTAPAFGVPSAVVDQDMYKTLMRELDAANLPGPDMYEFLAAYKSTANVAMDDTSRVRMVLATLMASGAKIEPFYDSVPHYLQILDKAAAKFDAAVKDQLQSDVAAKENEVKTLQQMNETNKAQIAQLTKEITDNEARVRDLSSQVEETKYKLNQKAASFKLTVETLRSEINGCLTKIKSIGTI